MFGKEKFASIYDILRKEKMWETIVEDFDYNYNQNSIVNEFLFLSQHIAFFGSVKDMLILGFNV